MAASQNADRFSPGLQTNVDSSSKFLSVGPYVTPDYKEHLQLIRTQMASDIRRLESIICLDMRARRMHNLRNIVVTASACLASAIIAFVIFFSTQSEQCF